MSNNSPDQEQPQAPFDISPEFIEENRGMNLVKPRKKFAPYTKKERLKRRKEVYRLHFEQGLPAVRISEIMNVDKNTINNDIRLLYRELGKESSDIDFDDYFAKQIVRLETQRSRLMSYLEKTEEIEKKLAIERMVADIDFKITNALSKVEFNKERFWDAVYKQMNKTAEEKKLDWRFTTLFEAIKISSKNRKHIDKLLTED